MVGGEEIERRVGFHPAGPATAPVFELNRALIRLVANVWDQALPPGRELSLALTALEEALMRANQAVACNADPDLYVVPGIDVATLLDDVLERLEGPILSRSGPAGTFRRLSAASSADTDAYLRGETEIDTDPRARRAPGLGLVVEPPITGPPVTRERIEAPTFADPDAVLEGPELTRIRADKHLDDPGSGPILTRGARFEQIRARHA